MVAMQFFGETAENRVLGVRGDAFDNQLPSRDAEGQRRPILEQTMGPPQHAVDGRRERRVAVWIHGMPLERHRQGHQVLSELGRQLGTFRPGRVSHDATTGYDGAGPRATSKDLGGLIRVLAIHSAPS